MTFEETQFGDIIRGEVSEEINQLLATEESSADDLISAFTSLHSRRSISSLMWDVDPNKLLWYVDSDYKFCFDCHLIKVSRYTTQV